VEISIRFVRKWPAEEIINLYKAGGWWQSRDGGSNIMKIITGSFAFAVAVEKETNKAVGMGRVLSDGASDAYIQDVVVLPGYRKQEVGKKLIIALRDLCLKKKVSWIALVAEEGTEDFYRSLGFQAMIGHTPMRYNKK
jgi:ribosomal protein S18 acetylase RimI-like enzyme